MSTVALDPTDASTGLRPTDIGGVAASQVSTMRFTMTSGQIVDVPILGDVYGLQDSQIPGGALASVAALSGDGEVLWQESFR
jgi:hypothetical protein